MMLVLTVLLVVMTFVVICLSTALERARTDLLLERSRLSYHHTKWGAQDPCVDCQHHDQLRAVLSDLVRSVDTGTQEFRRTVLSHLSEHPANRSRDTKVEP